MSLIPSDVGRPIDDIRPKIQAPDLSRMIDHVLSRLTPVERTLRGDDQRWYNVTVRPYVTADSAVDGAVVSVVDVDALKRAEQLLTEARDYAEGIVETVREGLVVLDGGVRVQSANRAFYETFKLSQADVERRALFELDGGVWDVPELRALVGQGEFGELRIERAFPRVGDRVLLVSGRRIAGTPRLLLAVDDVTETERADAVLDAQRKVLEYQEKLQRVAFDATVAEERERRRIAVDLHDGIGQALAAARLKLMSAHDRVRGEARNLVQQALDLVAQTIADARTLMFDLSPPVLYDLGFWEALDWLAEDVEARHDLEVEVVDDETRPPFDETTAAILFRSVRELLANAVKHSGTKRVQVRMRTDADRYEIEVLDGGRGFDCAALTASRTGGFGLFSVREQVSRLRGTFDITAAPASGTRATLRVPVPAATAQAPKEGGR